MDTSSKNFSRYFPISVRDRKWGWHVTTVGQKESLVVGKAFLGNSRREHKFYVEVAVVGRTRVISFRSVPGQDDQPAA